MRLRRSRISWWLVALTTLSALVAAPPARAVDPSWPKEVTFAILSTESAPEITRRWAPVLAQLEKDRVPDTFAQGGAFFGGGFVKADDSRYQIVRELNDAAKRLSAQK